MSLDSLLNLFNRFFTLCGIGFSLLLSRTTTYDGRTMRLTGPRRLRLFLEQSGGAFLKLGQILALRTDVLAPRYTSELMRLLSHVPKESFGSMEAVFIEEFGESPETYFAEFSSQPIAAASIGQVYKAKMVTGETVAVKIQRPGIREQFENDFSVARFGADVLSLLRIAPSIDWHEVVEEFVAWTRRELDFTIEAKSAQTIARYSSMRPLTHIPHYYTEISTRRVLISEFVDALLLVENVIDAIRRDPAESDRLREEDGVDVNVMAEYFVTDMIRQFFIDGFFHADPHPANIYLLSGNRLGYLDFGIIGEAGKERVTMLQMLHAISERDMYVVAKSLFSFARFAFAEDLKVIDRLESQGNKDKIQKALSKIEEIMVDNMVESLHDIFDPWYSAMEAGRNAAAGRKVVTQYSASRAFSRLVKTSRGYSLYFPREVALFFRTISIIDMVALQLSSSFNFLQALEQFFKEFPLATAERLIEEGTYKEEIGEHIDIQNLSYEEMMEVKVMEREQLTLARERLADLVAHYAERYDEVRTILKS